MRNLVPAVSITLMLAGSASADLIIDFGSHNLLAGQSVTSNGWAVTGQLTAVSISFSFFDDAFTTMASHLALVLNNHHQIGGLDRMFGPTIMEAQWDFPNNGFNGWQFSTVAFSNSSASYDLLIGNDSWQSEGASWSSVHVTLHGVNAVPAPGAIALLGMAGLVSRRRLD